MDDKISDVEEYESSVNFKISKDIFDKILEKAKSYNLDVFLSNIIYFKDNIRISNNQYQKKDVQKVSNILKLISKSNILFFPLMRKYSIEKHSKQSIEEITCIICRYNLLVNRSSSINCRIAIEEHSTIYGLNYYFSAEVEYSKEVSVDYELLIETEEFLINTIFSLFSQELSLVLSSNIFDEVKLETMFKVPSRVFSSFNEEKYSKSSTDCILIKFDGFKGRISFSKNKLLYYDDLENMYELNNLFFKFAENIIFQIEIINKKKINKTSMQFYEQGQLNNDDELNTIIIVDILGGYINNKLYMPEPLQVIQFFEFLRCNLNLEHKIFVISNLNVARIRLQKNIKDVQNKYTETLPYDGFLVISNNRIIKYKIPTIDVIVKNGYLQLDDHPDALTHEKFENLDDNKIYEVAPRSTNKANIINNNDLDNDNIAYEILRERKDRIYPSTYEQYKNFKNEIKYMRKHMI